MTTPAPLLPKAVHARLTTRNFGRAYHHFASADSTQRLAAEAARTGAPEGSVFVAERQTAGRGRQGHRWESAAGEGIYCSLILRPGQPLAALLPLTLGAGLALADGVAAVCGAVADIRWPNDLLLGGKKFCGVMLECGGDAHLPAVAILGFGINVAQIAFPPGLQSIATSLRLEGYELRRVDLLAAALEHLERRYRQMSDEGAAAVLAEFEQRSRYARGLEVRVGTGGEAYCGRTNGLDPNGFLRVQLADGSQRLVITGEVRPA